MPKRMQGRVLSRPLLRKLLQDLSSRHAPAKVVTPRGTAPRGTPAVWKCADPRYQSLIEEDCARVVDIASCITAFETHPLKLDLQTAEGPLEYTPDLLLWSDDLGALVEVKPEEKLSDSETTAHLKEVVSRLRGHGVHLCLMLDTDVRAAGLQTTLELLQRERPARGRYQADVDATLWDPHGRMQMNPGQVARWLQAQQICDDLLLRVMRRDPDDLLTAA